MIIRQSRKRLLISNLSGSTRNTSDWLGKPRHSYAVSSFSKTFIGMSSWGSVEVGRHVYVVAAYIGTTTVLFPILLCEIIFTGFRKN